MEQNMIVSGNGSEEQPFRSADGTAGLQTALNSLTHGGCLELSSSRYDLEKTIVIDSCSQALVGKVWCCNTDPNGVFESKAGTKLRLIGTDFPAIRMGDTCDPISGSKICELGIQGDISGMDTRPLVDFDHPEASAGICIDKVRCDQCHFTNLSFCGLATGIYSAGTAMTDACVFENINVDGCGNGFWISPRACVYTHIRSCVAADTPYYGVYVCGTGKRIHSLEILSTHFVRNGGAFTDDSKKIPAAVLLKDVDRCEVTHCLFDAPGTFWHYPDHAVKSSDRDAVIKRKTVGLYVIGNSHRICNNSFYNSSDDSIRIEGNDNILISNVCDGNVRISGKGTFISTLVFTKPDARLILEGDAKDSTVIFGVEEHRIIKV